MVNLSYQTREGASPHIKWIELKKDGIMHECAVMKTDPHGNVYFFELGKIDAIDKQRMARILKNRNADRHELWDLMSQTTLNNGVNALDYFHQLVKIISPLGVIYTPRGGVIGTERRAGEVAMNTDVNPLGKDVPAKVAEAKGDGFDVNPLGKDVPAKITEAKGDGFTEANPSITENK